ncbi:MAG TPA: type II secretion system protein [Phycisphaerae bacterium]|nr:type II secretion system protein [Phycisphaerae bacterium]
MVQAGRRHAVGGFTIIELLVVISIITVLLAILMPALSDARENGREAVCKAQLNQFGHGALLYANANDDFLCSGSFDPEVASGRDGPVDQVGWVADLVNSASAFPAQQLCPSNPARYNQKLGINGHTYTPAEAMDLVRRGYNTNYTQAWYMARTEFNPNGRGSLKSVPGTFGPLNTSALKNVDSARVPLVGDARTDLDDKVLGERSVKTMTDGPYGGDYGPQNYADFGPAHGRGSWIRLKDHAGIRANVVMADGHVSSFKDNDRDGEFALDDSVDPPVQKDLTADVFDGVLSLGRRWVDPSR